mmetsp:Transcript_6066/g.17747  ORF Transcript_6066/g.17747 Transcript_6066/m.17747 type:complete len:261 (+) Transcript_6066:2212-2994(+)
MMERPSSSPSRRRIRPPLLLGGGVLVRLVDRPPQIVGVLRPQPSPGPRRRRRQEARVGDAKEDSSLGQVRRRSDRPRGGGVPVPVPVPSTRRARPRPKGRRYSSSSGGAGPIFTARGNVGGIWRSSTRRARPGGRSEGTFRVRRWPTGRDGRRSSTTAGRPSTVRSTPTAPRPRWRPWRLLRPTEEPRREPQPPSTGRPLSTAAGPTSSTSARLRKRRTFSPPITQRWNGYWRAMKARWTRGCLRVRGRSTHGPRRRRSG